MVYGKILKKGKYITKPSVHNIFVKGEFERSAGYHRNLNLWNGCSHSDTSFKTNTHCYFSMKTGETGDINLYNFKLFYDPTLIFHFILAPSKSIPSTIVYSITSVLSFSICSADIQTSTRTATTATSIPEHSTAEQTG